MSNSAAMQKIAEKFDIEYPVSPTTFYLGSRYLQKTVNASLTK